jgi:hypothetical protein
MCASLLKLNGVVLLVLRFVLWFVGLSPLFIVVKVYGYVFSSVINPLDM